ncbi:MAG: right-handed parallel beta-helix repeat-containing protein [Chthoniobacteraceae bacterium]
MHRFLILVFLLARGHAAEWFVLPAGADSNPGTKDAPFATLARARDEVRKHKGEARTVHIRAGLYELAQGLKFNADDSGTAAAPVLWRAFENEKPVLIGGRAIKEWKPWKNGILQADLGAQGFKGAAFKQLLFAGQRQILARYPNFDPKNPYGGGWAYADGEYWPMYVDNPDENKHTLKVKNSDWRKWSRPQDVEVFVFPRYNWWNDILPVKSVDEASYTITTGKDGSYAMRANDRYFFQGALEELDAPGEWVLDKAAGVIYFKPPEGITLDGNAGNLARENGGADRIVRVTAPTTRDILTFEGTDYLTVRGLTFECAEGSAIVMRKCSHNRVIGCTVRNVGDFRGTGIGITEGEDNGVIGCDISFTGSHGVSLAGGDRPTLTGSGHFVDNCYIHHVGVFYKQGVGVSLSGTGQRVSHSLIHDTPRFAIQFTGNNHILEYNHLRHLALETEDVGATYCGGRDWLSPRGSIIRYNFIHDVLGYGWNGKWTSPYFAWGIYLDDNSGGVDVIGNIVARCGRSLMHGHSARDARVENNIFVEGGLRQWEFNGWLTTHRFWTSHFESMAKGYESVANLPAWKNMRGMQTHPKDIPDAEGRVMSGNVFTKNIIAWKNPEAKALNVVAFNPGRNTFDHNLYWHHGQPLKTGIRKSGKTIGENLIANPGFEIGELGTMPKDWNFQIRTPQAKAVLAEEAGRRVLRMDAAFDEAKKRDNYPIVVARETELQPGHSYRLRARLRTDRESAKASLLVQYYHPARDSQPAHFWASSPSDAKVTTQWQDFEFIFSIPAKGEKGWHERMKNFRVRLGWAEKEGALFADDLSLEEVETLDEWQSWQMTGGDRHSLIADPKFLAPEKDDYRLAPDSPAFKLGFQQIPVEKIGLYASPERATWPIVEAEGAREHPLSQ